MQTVDQPSTIAAAAEREQLLEQPFVVGSSTAVVGCIAAAADAGDPYYYDDDVVGVAAVDRVDVVVETAHVGMAAVAVVLSKKGSSVGDLSVLRTVVEPPLVPCTVAARVVVEPSPVPRIAAAARLLMPRTVVAAALPLMPRIAAVRLLMPCTAVAAALLLLSCTVAAPVGVKAHAEELVVLQSADDELVDLVTMKTAAAAAETRV